MMKIYLAAKSKLSAAAAKLAKKDEGASLVEYGLLVALIACACIVAITALGTSLSGMFSGIATTIGGVDTSGS
jgi:pilus assembly protein Flp/PilA